MPEFGNTNLTFLRNLRRDVYENVSNKRKESGKHRNRHRERDCHKHERDYEDIRSELRQKVCDTICDKLCLTPPENACEKKCVSHEFEVSLGDCKVIRDVNIVHRIKANLEHHIKENIICNHDPCTKHTHEELSRVDNGKHCKVDFPECDKDIKIVDEWDSLSNDSSKTSKSTKTNGSAGSEESDDTNKDPSSKSSEHKHRHHKCSKHHKKHKCSKHHKKHQKTNHEVKLSSDSKSSNLIL